MNQLEPTSAIMAIRVTSTNGAIACLVPNTTFSCDGVTVEATATGCVVTRLDAKMTMTSGSMTIDSVTVEVQKTDVSTAGTNDAPHTSVSTTGTKEVVALPSWKINRAVNIISVTHSTLRNILHRSTGLFCTDPAPLTKEVGMELRAIMDKCDADLSLDVGIAEVCLNAYVDKLYTGMKTFGTELINRCQK
jgi:hypothetical protein